MPPTGYLTAAGIEASLQHMATTYPAICQLIVLPEQSHEGRTIRAIKIAAASAGDRRGILFIGGVHAREIVNPDLLVSFALKLLQAYTANTDLTFGPTTYPATTVQLLVNRLDIVICPLANPDGRVYVQSPTGDAFWRKNRSPNPGQPCRGVDINRNYDFLWSSGIGTSANSCTDIFKGPSAFSEPETRNVCFLLDAHPNTMAIMDVHSYSQLVLYPWGDDNNQTTDPSMNFRNPAFDGLRGTPGDSLYREYIRQADADWFATTGTRVRDAIAGVRGRSYTVQQGVLLYPTSGTSNDYAYSRHLVDATKRKVFAYVLETGLEFQPPFAEALNIISEVSAGLVEFCLAALCAVDEIVQGTALAAQRDAMRQFRDTDLVATAAGKRYLRLLEEHSAEIAALVLADRAVHERVLALAQRVNDVVLSRTSSQPKVFETDLIAAIERELEAVSERAGPKLQRAWRCGRI